MNFEEQNNFELSMVYLSLRMQELYLKLSIAPPVTLT